MRFNTNALLSLCVFPAKLACFARQAKDFARMLPPIGFWSYTGSDDRHSSGKLSHLRRKLASEMQQQLGKLEEVSIFQDKAMIPLGADWDRHIRAAIGASSFMIPILTPAFLQSQWCCKELALFRQTSASLDCDELVFPIHFVDIEPAKRAHPPECVDDDILRFLNSRQTLDFLHLRHSNYDGQDVALALERLAKDICQALRSGSIGRLRGASRRQGFTGRQSAYTTEDLPPKGTGKPDEASRKPANDDEPRFADTVGQPVPGPIPKGARLLPQLGHCGGVRSIAFLLRGHRALSGGTDGTLKLWDVDSGCLIRTLYGHDSVVQSVAVSKDSRWALSGSWDKTLKLWDLTSGALVRTVGEHTEPVCAVAFSPLGTQVLSGSMDQTLKLWDVQSCGVIRSFSGHDEAVTSVAFSPDGRKALSGSCDCTMKLWTVANGRLERTFKDHRSKVLSVAFAPDGALLLSGSADGTLKLWNEVNEVPLGTFDQTPSMTVESVAFSSQGTFILSAGADASFTLWERAADKPLKTMKTVSHTNRRRRLESSRGAGAVACAVLSPDDRKVLFGGTVDRLQLWDAAQSSPVRIFADEADPVSSVAFLPDGTRAVSAGMDKTLKLWNLRDGTLIRTFQPENDPVVSVAIATNGHRAITAGKDEPLKLWNLASGAMVRSFTRQVDMVSCLALTPDGTLALSGSSSGALSLWDAAKGTVMRTFEDHDHMVHSVCFAPDTRLAVSGGSDKALRLWNVAEDSLVRRLDGHRDAVRSVAFSDDGALMASGSDDATLMLWEVAKRSSGGLAQHSTLWPFARAAAETAKLRTILVDHAGSVRCVAFASDGSRVISGSDDKTIKLWDVASNTLIRTFKGHEAGVTSVAFAPNGRTIVSGSRDGTMKLWDVTNGTVRATFIASGGAWAVFAADGRFVASGDPQSLIALVRGTERLPMDAFVSANRVTALTPLV